MMINDPHFGDNVTTALPQLMGGPWDCGSERAPIGSCPMGLNALPVGLRSIRFDGVDRHLMLDADADNILPGWNAENQSWAPDAPCQPDIVAQEKGPYPGIWLGDHSACKSPLPSSAPALRLAIDGVGRFSASLTSVAAHACRPCLVDDGQPVCKVLQSAQSSGGCGHPGRDRVGHRDPTLRKLGGRGQL